MRLTAFELRKIWGKPSFLLSVCVLLVVNLFLMWYINLPDEGTPPLSAYKAFIEDIASMSESEKTDYIDDLKAKVDGIAFVQTIQGMQNMGNEMGASLAQQEMEANPGLFEKYYDLYQSGDYLIYTDSFAKESALIQELYEENSKVSGYSDYLESVQKNKDSLSGISIFGSTESFSTRNTQKSAKDYDGLENTEIQWQPSKGISAAMENSVTDVLLLLGIFLFVGSLIAEEKEKGLFYITRGTKYGLCVSICSKLAALLIHCFVITSVMVGGNLVYAELTAGLGDLRVSIQSIAPYTESNLQISVLEYIALSMITKSLVFFAFGAFLTSVSICSRKGFIPYIAGLGILAESWLMYILVPGYSAWIVVKYLNLVGLLDTGAIFGGYLNLNIGGYPVSRLTLSWIVIAVMAVSSVCACLISFLHGKNLELTKTQITLPIRFRPHNNLLRHEAYKILITNRALLVLICFALLIGYYDLSQAYHPSTQEQYYQQVMLQLEGDLTEEKETLIQSEQARFDEAFAQIEKIDGLVASGELDATTGDAMKLEWESILTLYPAFQRMMQQYENDTFVYDTGYLYLFGRMDDSYLVNLLLLSLCVVLAFHNAISMEYVKKSWYLLGATHRGRKAILKQKIWICMACAAVMAVLPWIFRSICISWTFPMHSLTSSIRNIPAFVNFILDIPTLSFIFVAILSQILAVMVGTLVILAVSQWRKNDIQALFFGLLILVIPFVMKLMGFDFAGWFSTYPLYSWTQTA